MKKKLTISIAVLLALLCTCFGVYIIASPEVVIANKSSQLINELVVKLPSNRIVFGAVAPKSESSIYYSWSQTDGMYEYHISFANGVTQAGKCGYVTHLEIGKRLLLNVDADFKVVCTESSKI
jgi:hypothetical protein